MDPYYPTGRMKKNEKGSLRWCEKWPPPLGREKKDGARIGGTKANDGEISKTPIKGPGKHTFVYPDRGKGNGKGVFIEEAEKKVVLPWGGRPLLLPRKEKKGKGGNGGGKKLPPRRKGEVLKGTNQELIVREKGEYRGDRREGGANRLCQGPKSNRRPQSGEEGDRVLGEGRDPQDLFWFNEGKKGKKKRDLPRGEGRTLLRKRVKGTSTPSTLKRESVIRKKKVISIFHRGGKGRKLSP